MGSAPYFQRSSKFSSDLVDRKPPRSAVTLSWDGFKMITRQAFVIMSNQTDLQNQDLKSVPSFKIKKVGYFLQIK